ncbi:MAG TPA: DNA polymerase/3'-5' exonuclease PolX [Anaerolineaceae bacterium]|nr:DNA polymerase/3'-5' exonuclease PolX [Anaerolineaceae bacterium]
MEKKTAHTHFSNQQLAETFRLIADLLEIKGEVIYKVLAYRKAADSLEHMGQSAEELWQENRLGEIPGVGKAISEKMDELFSTGQLQFLEKLKAEVPVGLAELLQVPDVGPKKAKMFWKELGVTNVAELETAARAGKLRDLPGMGEKSEARILAGLEALSRRTTRTPLGVAWPFANEIARWLGSLPGVVAANPAGSLRRMRETVGDLDISAATEDPAPVMDAFIHHPRVIEVFAVGDVKSSVEFDNHLRAQLWLHRPEQYGTALLYATGSKDHNVRLREIAQTMKLSLSDRSFLQPDGSEKFYATEEEVYAVLGLPWIPPELREDRGEIQAAKAGRLPHLIEVKDIVAELHSHSTWSDGQASILEMAQAAQQRGLKAIAITDHSHSLGVTGGMTAEDIRARMAEVREAQAKMGDSFTILQGAEVEIRNDGRLDYPDEVLAELDVVIASLHTGLRQPKEQVTARLIKAIQNPHVDIIGHPTGRLIPDREGADLDMNPVLQAAKESGVALEINANPSRLDLDDIQSRRAIEMGIPLSINTDAHSPDNLDFLMYGVATARRGWVEPQHVINAWPVEKLVQWLKR